MRNLTPFEGHTIAFHDLVVQRKHKRPDDETYKERLAALREIVSAKFDEFDPFFGTPDFSTIACHGFAGQDKTDLLSLYSYRNTTLQSLKNLVTRLENGRYLNTCQYCTLNEVNSFDHYLPKDQFPEFIVNPKNLVPCCSNCNGRKGVVWRDKGIMQYINLYKHEMPDKQFLFVEILESNGTVMPRFYLENRFNIDVDVYNLLNSHYTKLCLQQRFYANSNTIVTELENLVLEYKDRLSREQIVEVVEGKAARDRKYFGYNFWKPILEEELIKNNLFMDPLL